VANSTAHRLLRSLCSGGFLQQDRLSRRYELSLLLYRLGNLAVTRSDLYRHTLWGVTTDRVNTWLSGSTQELTGRRAAPGVVEGIAGASGTRAHPSQLPRPEQRSKPTRHGAPLSPEVMSRNVTPLP
jgi:hypothetical protein